MSSTEGPDTSSSSPTANKISPLDALRSTEAPAKS